MEKQKKQPCAKKSVKTKARPSTGSLGGSSSDKGKKHVSNSQTVTLASSSVVARKSARAPKKNTAMATRSVEHTVTTPVGRYTVKPIIPAEKAELISVAKAMHREDMGSRLQNLFQPETEAAITAVQTGIYIGWRCSEFKWDCIRVSSQSRCFCGHLLGQHAPYNGKSTRVPCKHHGCQCKAFQFIPGRVEDIGEFWHQKRRDFDPSSWRAKCRCKHTHEEHECKTSLKRCKYPGCGCGAFTSNFLCAACDQHWEQHITVFETEEDRRQNGIPYGKDYIPFAEMPNLRNMALTGDEDDAGPTYRAITDGLGPIPQSRAITQDTPVRMPQQRSAFKPVWD